MFIAVEKLWDGKGIQPWGDLTFKKNVLYVPCGGEYAQMISHTL